MTTAPPLKKDDKNRRRSTLISRLNPFSKEKEIEISQPKNFQQTVHVHFNRENGAFEGLLPEWNALLNFSGITTSDTSADPSAILRALEFQKKLNDGRSLDVPDGPSEVEETSTEDETSEKSSIDTMETPRDRAYGKENVPFFPHFQFNQFCETPRNLEDVSFTNDPEKDYKVTKQIGKGKYGTVYSGVFLPLNEKVAIKQIRVNKSPNKNNLVHEILLLNKCQHECITRYKSSHIYKGILWLIMEFVNGFSLSHIISQLELSEPHVGYISLQILRAIEYLHRNNIIHRDVKTDNVLVGLSGEVKITDFGLATNVSLEQPFRKSIAGTTYYMAPEIVTSKQYDKSVDIWSLGVVTQECVEGKPPHSDQSPLRALFLIALKGRADFSSPENMSASLKDFIDKCTQYEPSQRPSASDLLRHSFFSNSGEAWELAKMIKNSSM